jgi:ATP-dependent helicase HrpB
LGPPLPTSLPIEGALPALLDAMARAGQAVLQAPPGAGKTTRVPLALLEAGAFEGRLVMLEPRRLAARAAAERMAETLGEPVGRDRGLPDPGRGEGVGRHPDRGGDRGHPDTDAAIRPDLPGIGAVIFDEFHERSLNADLGLALAWEVRARCART